MDIISLLNDHRMITEVVYNFFIVFICLYISWKAQSLYSLSNHKGIRYFRNAFLFFALGFGLRFVLMWASEFYSITFPWLLTIVQGVLHYALSMSGFYLVLSLIWKRLDALTEKEYTLHLLGIGIAVLNFIAGTENFMFFTMFAILGYAIIISYGNFIEDKGEHSFLRFYYFAMILAFIGWGANFLTQFIAPFYPPFRWYVYLVTWAVFVMFGYGVFKIR